MSRETPVNPAPEPPHDAPEAEDPVEASRMPLWEHLDELRKRIIYCLLIVSAGTVVTYNFSTEIVRFLEQPLLVALPEGQSYLYFTGIADKFFIYLKVSVMAAALLTLPFLLHQVWLFIAPALYRNERRFLGPFLFCGSLAFLLGTTFAYYGVLPFGYKFLIDFGSPQEKPIITLTEYFGLTLKLLFAMGLIFELPVVFVLLARFGILGSKTLTKWRRHAFVGNAILAAVITPTPDIFTMLLVLVPLTLLYEIGVLGVKFVEKKEP